MPMDLHRHIERRESMLDNYEIEIVEPPLDPKFLPVPYEEDVLKHGSHDQKTHGSWATGNYENLAEWLKAEDAVFGSKEEKDKYIREHLLSQREAGFSQDTYPEFARAIHSYTGSPGYEINEVLRDEQISNEGYQNIIDKLDKAIKVAPPLGEELIAYRGVKGNGLDFFETLKTGDTYTDKAFTSTTIDAGVAQQFGGSMPYYEGLVFKYKLPAGTKGIFPAGYRDYEADALGNMKFTPKTDEAEFLLPRDSKFKVVAQRGRVWDVELVP